MRPIFGEQRRISNYKYLVVWTICCRSKTSSKFATRPTLFTVLAGQPTLFTVLVSQRTFFTVLKTNPFNGTRRSGFAFHLVDLSFLLLLPPPTQGLQLLPQGRRLGLQQNEKGCPRLRWLNVMTVVDRDDEG